MEIDGENVLRMFFEKGVVSRKCCKCYKSQALPAAKERSQEFRMEMWMFTMWLRAGFGGMTQGASAFSAGTASSRKGQCSDLTRPFFADSHWEAEPYQRLFLQLKELQRGIELPPGIEVSGHVTGRLSVPSQPSGSASSIWARHSETLLTPDCAAAARAEATVQSFENYSNVEVMSTTPIYNLPIRGDCPDAGFLLAVFAVVPFHHPTHHSHGKRMGIERI